MLGAALRSPYPEELWAPWTAKCIKDSPEQCLEDCNHVSVSEWRGLQEEMWDVLLGAKPPLPPVMDDGFPIMRSMVMWHAWFQNVSDRPDMFFRSISLAKLHAISYNRVFLSAISGQSAACQAMYLALSLFSHWTMSYIQAFSQAKIVIRGDISSLRWPNAPSLDDTLRAIQFLKQGDVLRIFAEYPWTEMIQSGWPFFLMYYQQLTRFLLTNYDAQIAIVPDGAAKQLQSSIRHAESAIYFASNVQDVRVAMGSLHSSQIGFTNAIQEAQGDKDIIIQNCLAHAELFLLLARLQRTLWLLHSSSISPRIVRPSASVQVIYCGAEDVLGQVTREVDSQNWGLTAWVAASPTLCGLKEVAPWMIATAKSGIVIVVSPWARSWRRGVLRELKDKLGIGRMRIVGAQTLSGARHHWWPARRVKMSGWHATFEVPPGGSLFDNVEGCFAADTTSGTRVYASGVFDELLDLTTSHTSDFHVDRQYDSSLLVELDLRAASKGIRAYTCILESGLVEDDYLSHAQLFRRTSWNTGVETLRVEAVPGPSGKMQTSLEKRYTVVHDSWTSRILVGTRGLFAPPSHQRAVVDAHEEVKPFDVGEEWCIPLAR
eukprot:TRINITY_DN8035_c0_g1_i2.p1 TRINITY_DN8035_c0_g1~~TRINITY_DN8035_c0_g1_i2.p1  ORF type:complete len:602 (+),score=72.57 TRINITY_DN8035_c0_g1_i2:303-2108(+)